MQFIRALALGLVTFFTILRASRAERPHLQSLHGPFVHITSKPQAVFNDGFLRVKFRFGHVPFQARSDIIAVFSCSTMNCSTDSFSGKGPVQYKYAKDLPKGEGEFHIVIRADMHAYRLAYVGGSVRYPEIVALSEPIQVEEELRQKPRQVRLSLVAGRTDQIRVMWNLPKDREKSVRESGVFFGMQMQGSGQESGGWSHEFTGFANVSAVYKYEAKDMCDRLFQPAGTSGYRSGGLQLESLLTGLVPDRTYVYKIKGSSEVYRFKSPPRLGNSKKSLSIVVFGDMGQSLIYFDGNNSRQHSFDFDNRGEIPATDTARSLARLVAKEEIAVVNHIGDISYATGQLSLWDNFMLEIQPAASRVPWMTAIGNHEMGFTGSFLPGGDSQGECGVPYASLFPFARLHPLSPSGEMHTVTEFPLAASIAKPGQAAWKPYYSYDLAMVHVTVISTEHNFTSGSEQHAWLAKDLAGVDRTLTPWVFVMGHRPIYVAANFPAPGSSLLEKEVAPILAKYKVDVYFGGHHHSYQRTRCPVRDGRCDAANGTVHVTSGSAGYAHSPFGKKASPSGIFQVLENKTWGYSVVRVSEDKPLSILFIRNTDDKVIDEFSVINRNTVPASPYSQRK